MIIQPLESKALCHPERTTARARIQVNKLFIPFINLDCHRGYPPLRNDSGLQKTADNGGFYSNTYKLTFRYLHNFL